ncbi:unnamed protein product [Coregonus sp. 'balchen']|nr:unnamed protein product [Coregonus sp. 'balchen']
MALFYTRCLQELPKITVTDVHRLAKTSSKAPTSKLEKGFKLYASSYLFNYEVLQLEEAYNNFDPLSKPLIYSMGMSAEKLLVDSHFGKVQVGSLLSYQQPPITTRHIVHHKETPPFPSLLESNFQGCTFVLSEEDKLHIESLQVSFATAHKIEQATREQSAVSDWQVLRKPRDLVTVPRGLPCERADIRRQSS